MTKKLQKEIEQFAASLQSDITLEDLRAQIDAIVDENTKTIKSRLEKLLEQKEELERAIEKKSEELQEQKYEIFNTLEQKVAQDEELTLKLHQIKLQSVDLYDILSELVESAIITALEKESDGDFEESLTETIKEITYESIKEGSLNTIRIRKILSTILATAIEVAEAEPNKASDLLTATLKGMRSGLIASIQRFKKRLAFMPVEAKHILIEDYDTIMEDLNQTDALFSQVVIQQASQSSSVIYTLLMQLNNEMKYDLEELIEISKETAEVMKQKFANFAKMAVKKADSAIHSKRAQEAKKMGIQAFSVAKSALGSAIQTAKDAIEKKKK